VRQVDDDGQFLAFVTDIYWIGPGRKDHDVFVGGFPTVVGDDYHG
jgi:hypothetical protein